jgi:predicted lipoprotein
MIASADTRPIRRRSVSRGGIIAAAVVVVVLVAMALDTKVVRIGSDQDVRAQAFSPDAFGEERFPGIQTQIDARAVDAAELAAAVMADKKAAGETYGVAGTPGPVMPVKFTGTAGEVKAGNYDVKIEGVPDTIRVRVQTGPAINGTELRDFPGDIVFGDFKNQIEYQNAGAGINNAMKKAVLAGVDTKALTGKSVTVTGVFRLINEKNWLVTPVRLSVQ